MGTARYLIVAASLSMGLFSPTWGAGEIRFQDKQGEYVDVFFGENQVLRYMYAHDTSSAQKVFETYKPFYHVYDGRQRLTNGPDGEGEYLAKNILYPHHRGIMIGWNKLTFEGKSYDLWHMKGVAQVHQGFEEKVTGPNVAKLTSVVHWNDPQGEPILVERRHITAYQLDDPTVVQLDFQSDLKAVRGDVYLDGDPEHAGIHYRPHNAVSTGPKEGKAQYLFHKDGIDAHKDRDLPWVAMSYVLDGRRYVVQQMSHPQNPKGVLWSAYRDYGRFGAFFKDTIRKDQTLTLRYRFWIARGETPSREALAARYAAYANPQARTYGRPWLGVHVGLNGRDNTAQLTEVVGALAQLGVNVIVAEINYGYEYQSHPELRSGNVSSKEQIGRLVAECRKHNVRLIPQFQCLGHQSWSKRTAPLLTKYPQFDETPGLYPGNEGIYCRSWCPLHPEVNPIIFALMDELLDAFDADAMHVGMDEVFLLGEDVCPRCKGRDKAELFAKAVNDYHRHLVEEKKVEMLMWGDRLIDAGAITYGKWEASANGTAPAIDRIARDIIICDWHYESRQAYESVPMFLEKGFRVWPASWKTPEAAKAFVDYSRAIDNPRMLGHLNTTWGAVAMKDLPAFEPLTYATSRFKKK